MSFDKIYDYAKSIGCQAQRDVPMSKYTTFRIGGNAAVMLTPTTDEQLASIIKKCKEENIKPFIIGNGSNIIFRDEGFDGTVIDISGHLKNYHIINLKSQKRFKNLSENL